MGHLKEISIESHQRNEVIKLDEQVAKFIADSGVNEGVCHVFVPHTTAGVIINEGADPDVARDILARLAHLVPHQGGYSHASGNADSHIKAAFVGSSVTVIVKAGLPLLGTWQSIFFCEFDGPRRRKVMLRVADT
jgi:secondary thiamine-phosphate synthase enzyme